MADNVAITAGTGTTIAADDVGGGVLQQRVKVTWGPDGTGNDVNETTPLPITSAPPTSVTATIANGASLSGVVQVKGKLSGCITPATWTAADITFSVSQDNVTYYDLYDNGMQRSIPSASVPTSGARFLALPLSDWTGINYLKVRSGLSAATVNQGGSRDIILVMAG